jgi:hypothetical protein
VNIIAVKKNTCFEHRKILSVLDKESYYGVKSMEQIQLIVKKNINKMRETITGDKE